jgi:hypothetical protein
MLAAKVTNGADPRTASDLRPTPLSIIATLIYQDYRFFSAGPGNLIITDRQTQLLELKEEEVCFLSYLLFKSIFIAAIFRRVHFPLGPAILLSLTVKPSFWN